MPRDTIRILSRADFDIKEPVRISGAVWQQGEFDYMPGMTLMDLLALAGGLKFGANSSRIEISRKTPQNGEMVTSRSTVDFGADPHFKLGPYDYVLVPEAKDASTFRTATIGGEVRYPGTYRLQRGDRLSDLIDRAGGFTDEAYYHGAKYTSERARVIQQQSIDRLIQELEIRTNQMITEQMQTAVDAADADAARSSALGVQALLAKLKQVKAEGRVAIKLVDLAAFRGSEHDFPVEDEDVLHVPKRPSFVSVVGSVYSPSAYLFQRPLSIDDYLEKSGGPTKTADEDFIYVVGADGVVRSKAQDGVSSRSFMNSNLMPGDTVVVPEDLDRVPYMRLFKDLTEIVFKIATTAGVVYAII
jgi:protein involved in polysaccharide export with SLBB domain